MNNNFITVVIAAKAPPRAQLELCLASFASLRNAPNIELVLVLSGLLPEISKNLISDFSNFKVIEVLPEGVYSAYNAGIKKATGNYLLFFGVDDIALPGMDSVIDRLADKSDFFHLYAAACYMQSVGIAQPSQWRASLVFRNWCHQGIFYQRSYLLSHAFQSEYFVQADHKMNIDIVSNHSMHFGVSKEVIAYFSAGGVSSLRPDLKFRKDFPMLVAQAYGKHFGFMVKLKQLLIDIIMGDAEKRFRARTGR